MQSRAPTPDEDLAITRRARDLPPEQLIDLFKMPAETFLAWLHRTA